MVVRNAWYNWIPKRMKGEVLASQFSAVYDAIAPILNTVSPAECANYFANAGYDQT